jgi:hypothetical protein
MPHFVDSLSMVVLTIVNEPLACLNARVERQLMPLADWTVKSGPLHCEAVYFPHPQRGGANPLSLVMWSPRSNPETTIFYPDSADGWDLLVLRLSKAGMVNSTSIRSTTSKEPWQLQEIHCRDRGNSTRRLLQLLQEEGGIKCLDIGKAYPFEDESMTPCERISSRRRLLGFVKKLGLDLRDDTFWETDSEAIYYFENSRGWQHEPTEKDAAAQKDRPVAPPPSGVL